MAENLQSKRKPSHAAAHAGFAAARSAQIILRSIFAFILITAAFVFDVPVPRFKPMGPHTNEDTISLLRRLAALYPDEVIAGILNRQDRKTATGERFTANQVGSLRRYRNIPRFQPSSAEPPTGELVSIRKAAQILGMNTSSIHRWLADGFIAGEQVTPGAPWQIRITDELRARIVQQAPPEYLPMLETTLKLGVSRQTVLQRVKRASFKPCW